MIETVPDILARIVAHKRAEVSAARVTREEWERLAASNRKDRRDFRDALPAHPPAVIAEIKKASPSKGLIAAIRKRHSVVHLAGRGARLFGVGLSDAVGDSGFYAVG